MKKGTRKKSKGLGNARVLLGITGSVAAYKAVDLIRRLTDEGALVTAVMTDASCRFITPLSVELATGPGRTFTGMFDDPLSHIDLAASADIMLVAPTTANTVAKFARGTADDLLSTCFLAFRGPVLVAPAMNWRMYESAAFRENLETLMQRGVVEVEPGEGPLACGEEGKGRMASIDDILEAVGHAVESGDLAGRKILVTAGPTREPLDPVRFISNRSSGKMGYAIVRAALARGAKVTLISGPTALHAPEGARLISVETAEEMREAVMAEVAGSDALIMAAAVADFRPSEPSTGKKDKNAINEIRLAPCPDILSEVSKMAGGMKQRPVIVGFAAEVGEDVARAREKLESKGADFIVFNNVARPDAGFDVDTNKVTILGLGPDTLDLPVMSKDAVAHEVLNLLNKK